MVCPLCPRLANVYLRHFGKKRLSECPVKFLPNVYKSYVNDNDIFVTFDSYTQLLRFIYYMKHQHPNTILNK